MSDQLNISTNEEPHETELVVLFQRYLEGDLSTVELSRLNSLLHSSEQTQTLFVRYLTQEAFLAEVAPSEASGPTADIGDPSVTDGRAPAATPIVPLAGSPATGGDWPGQQSIATSDSKGLSQFLGWMGRPSSFLALAFMVTALMAALVVNKRLQPVQDLPGFSHEIVLPADVPAAIDIKSVARLTAVCDAAWRDGSLAPKKDQLLKVGERLDLVGGFAEVTFECGAVVMLNAPASVVIKAPNGGKIEFGKITARVPGASAKFWFQTPNNRILDLGTEFGVAVDAAGLEQIRVFDGAVEIGSDQQSRVNERTLLKTGEVAVFGPGGDRVNAIGLHRNLEDSFVRTMPNNYESDYVRQVLSGQPAGYWSFNSVITSSLIPDVSGNGRFGYMNGNALIAQGGSVLAIGQAIRLDGSMSYVSIPAANSLSLAEDFSIELLFRTPTGGPLISKVAHDGSWSPGAKLLYVRGGEVRFTPYTNSRQKVIRADVYINDDQWHHVMITNKSQAVNGNDCTVLYVDGVEEARCEDWRIDSSGDDLMPMRIGVGCKEYPIPKAARFPDASFFDGHLDEIVIYNRSVSASEVKDHYYAYLEAGVARQRMAPNISSDPYAKSYEPASEAPVNVDSGNEGESQ